MTAHLVRQLRQPDPHHPAHVHRAHRPRPQCPGQPVLLSSELRRNLAARDRHPATVLDLRYDDLVAAPGATAQRIYQRFNLDWTAATARGLRRYVHQNPPGRHGAHHYPLDAGLPPAEVAAAFHPYQQSWPSGPTLFSQPS